VFVILAAVSAVAAVCAGGLHVLNTPGSGKDNPWLARRPQAYRDSTGVPHHRMEDGRTSEFASLWLRDMCVRTATLTTASAS